MSWGKEWPVSDVFNAKNAKLIYDRGTKLKEEAAPILEKVYNNKMPTHDPYANPDSHVYYQCQCGAILDPCTKSFAALNNHASNVGWKVRWKTNGEGYEPFCVECGEGVE